MYFVPEGQHDSSQVRSAWVAIQKDPVPEGRSKSWSVPEIFVVETELMPASETLGIPVEKFGSDGVRLDFGCNEWFLAIGRHSH